MGGTVFLPSLKNAMGDRKNLGPGKSLEKMTELAEDAKLCMFITGMGHVPFHARPMALQEVDEDGTCWFFSAADSRKNADIKDDHRVQLAFLNRSKSEFMTLYGTAEIVRDVKKAKELWNVFLTTWFDGADDPNLTMIRFKPEQGHYWDTKSNKMVQSISIAIGAIRGKMTDHGVEGEMTIR